jgi:predicted metal-dependent HD superfamily phosphohydrolase
VEHSIDNHADLRERWNALAASYRAPEAVAAKWFEKIVEAYSEPGRHYHTLDHIRSLFSTLDIVRRYIITYPIISFAVWFHDFVYDPQSDENEEISGLVARVAMREMLVPDFYGAVVEDLILATRTHEINDQFTDALYFLDADLAILGAPPEEYRRYSEAIRKEYAWADDATYRSGRRAVLESLLARDKIYRTPPMFDRFEQQARENMEGEMMSYE